MTHTRVSNEEKLEHEQRSVRRIYVQGRDMRAYFDEEVVVLWWHIRTRAVLKIRDECSVVANLLIGDNKLTGGATRIALTAPTSRVVDQAGHAEMEQACVHKLIH